MNPTADTLEREHELDRIAATLDSAAGGAGRGLIIEGPAGIGKTRLVQDARALAKARGFGRLQATGDELEGAMAWSVVRQMVERSILRYGGDIREQLLAGPSGAALRTLDKAPTEAPAPDAAVARTLHALWWVAVDLSSYRPLLITVDDAQWADLPSLRFLLYLSRRIADLPIAVIVGTRPPHEPAGPLAELCTGHSGERMLPRPLSPDGVAALSVRRGIQPAAGVVAALHSAGGGNPFLTGRLLDELDVRGMALDAPRTAEAVGRLGPSAISRALLSRLEPDAIALAGAAAALGARSDPRLAAAVAGHDGPSLAAATDALVAGHVLTGEEDQLEFVHPVVREAVLAQLGPGERASLHAQAARALAGAGAPVARVAAHLALAPPGTLPDAVALLRQAAAGLLADGDPVTAATHLSRALDESPADPGLQGEAGFALLRAGRPARARELLRAAAAVAADPVERAQRLAGAATATSMLDDQSAAIAELRATLDAWPEAGADAGRLVLEARLGTLCSLHPDQSRSSAERLRQFADLPGRTRDERTLLALLAQRGRYDVRPAREVAALAERALGSGAYLRDAVEEGQGLVAWAVAVLALLSTDAADLATAELARARATVRELGSPREFGMVSLVAGWLSWRTGDVAAAEAEAETSQAAIFGEDLDPDIVAICASTTHFGVLAALERGDRAAAAATLDAFDALDAAGTRSIPVISLGEARALLALAGDQPAEAHELALAQGAELRAAHLDTPTVAWRAAAAVAALRLGLQDEAVHLAAEQLELARRSGAATDVGAALRLTARVEPERRAERLGEAVTVLEGSPARLELARALVDLGEALRVARRRTDAHDPLRRAADLAVACRSPVLRQRAFDGLAALGDRPRKLMFSGPESLTASERRVAQLAVGGRSNRDIAQELFVTPKTVENHLGRVYIKLGVSGRRQLAGSLG